MIVCENYKFRFHRVLSSGETRWRCGSNTCNAFILTVGEVNARQLTSGGFDHNHSKISDRMLARQHVSAAAKRKAADEPCEQPAKILCSVLRHNGENLQKTDLKCIKENLYNDRRRRRLLNARKFKTGGVITDGMHEAPDAVAVKTMTIISDDDEESLLEDNLNAQSEMFLTYLNSCRIFLNNLFLKQ